MSRHAERQIRIKRATEIKDRGNSALRDGDLTKAELLYSEALDVERSVPAFWSNRAIVRIRLRKFREAIEDCDWAWRASNDRCPKAMSNMGHAYCALAEYDKAEECYQKLRKLGKKELADTYMARLTTAKEQHEKSEKIKKQLMGDKGKGNVEEMVRKLMLPDHEMIYYQGGFTLLAAILTEDPMLAELFATGGGYDLFLTPPGIVIEHPVRVEWIHLDPKSIRSNSDEVNELIATVWRLLHLTTRNHADRADNVINDLSFPSIMLASLSGGSGPIRQACLETTFHLSTVEVLRTRIILNFNRCDMLPQLTQAILNNNSDPDSISVSMQLIANLSRIPQFRKQFRLDFDLTIRPMLIEVLGTFLFHFGNNMSSLIA